MVFEYSMDNISKLFYFGSIIVHYSSLFMNLLLWLLFFVYQYVKDIISDFAFYSSVVCSDQVWTLKAKF